jgi:hypothetical protein
MPIESSVERLFHGQYYLASQGYVDELHVTSSVNTTSGYLRTLGSSRRAALGGTSRAEFDRVCSILSPNIERAWLPCYSSSVSMQAATFVALKSG